jgi:hypothetical protein
MKSRNQPGKLMTNSNLKTLGALCLILASTAGFAAGDLRTIYFSSQVDKRSATVVVKVGEETCSLDSSRLEYVNRSVGFINETNGITERLATCELQLPVGTHPYEVTITPANGKRKGFVYYWALDTQPIENDHAMNSWFNNMSENKQVRGLSASYSDVKISKNRILHSVGTFKVK